MMSQPFFSVVIPAYNSSAYLESALSSLQRQRWQSWEAIVVDDGSSDHTAEIAARIGKVDSRIRCISISHVGTQMARSQGALESSGRYLLFLDSDDQLLSNAMEKLNFRLLSSPTDILIFGLRMLHADGSIEDRCRELPEGFHHQSTLFRKMVLDRAIKSMGRKAVARELALSEDAFYQSHILSYGEDMLQSLQLFSRANFAHVTHDIYYLYQRRNDSTMATFCKDKYSDRILMYESIMHYGHACISDDSELKLIAEFYLLTHIADIMEELSNYSVPETIRHETICKMLASPAISDALQNQSRHSFSRRQTDALHRLEAMGL